MNSNAVCIQLLPTTGASYLTMTCSAFHFLIWARTTRYKWYVNRHCDPPKLANSITWLKRTIVWLCVFTTTLFSGVHWPPRRVGRPAQEEDGVLWDPAQANHYQGRTLKKGVPPQAFILCLFGPSRPRQWIIPVTCVHWIAECFPLNISI